MEQYGIVISDEESRRLAERLIVRRLADAGEWVDWEDVPLLAEGCYERLVADVEVAAEQYARRAALFDRAHDIDPLELMGRLA